MPVRLYTLEEASALLPRVIPVVERLRDAYLKLRALQAATAADARGATGDGSLLADPWGDEGGENRIDALNHDLRQAAAQLDRWGVELKDPERGLIDFRHERDGEVVYLCYMLGEPGIRFWHTLEGGFAARQPL